MRGERVNKTGVISGVLLPLGLICMFAFCSLALALLGGSAYRQIQGRVDDSFNSTVVANYLRTKLTTGNMAGAVSIREENNFKALVITDTSGDITRETRIFVIDGVVIEINTAADMPLSPAGGTHIATVKSCVFHISEDGLFTAEITSPAGVYTRTAFALVQGGAL